MNIKKKIGAAAVALSVLLAGNVFAEEKWMTGDWHQHTFFTDGTNSMGDVRIGAGPTFTILNGPAVNDPKAIFPAGDYKGVIPQGFRYGLDFQANSEHGGNRGSRDGFGRFWNDMSFCKSFLRWCTFRAGKIFELSNFLSIVKEFLFGWRCSGK